MIIQKDARITDETYFFAISRNVKARTREFQQISGPRFIGKQDQIDRTRPVEGWKLLYADRGAIELAKKRADGQVEKSGAWKEDPFEKILITEFSR